MSLRRNKLTVLELAILGVWLDDPYGDGIRLEKIRHPSPARQTALTIIHKKQYPLYTQEFYDEYGWILNSDEVWTKAGKLRAWIRNNCKQLQLLSNCKQMEN